MYNYDADFSFNLAKFPQNNSILENRDANEVRDTGMRFINLTKKEILVEIEL